MATFKIRHITRYTYNAPVIDSANQILLFPVVDMNQQVQKHELLVSNNPLIETFTDYFGNTVGLFTILRPHTEIIIQSGIDVTTLPVLIPDDLTPASEQWTKLKELRELFPYIDFLWRESFECQGELGSAVNELFAEEKTPLTVAKDLSAFVYKTFEYKQGITSVETSIDEVWKLKAGVCQDFAHILLVMLRKIGIPARYVSGYICPRNNEFRGEGATHAWVDAYIPYYGWIGLDPTNNCIVSDRHVRLAVGRNFSDCTPVKGTYKGHAQHSLEVSVMIENDTGEFKPVESLTPNSFSYQVKKEMPVRNSYQRHLEIQQQQQQQQQ